MPARRGQAAKRKLDAVERSPLARGGPRQRRERMRLIVDRRYFLIIGERPLLVSKRLLIQGSRPLFVRFRRLLLGNRLLFVSLSRFTFSNSLLLLGFLGLLVGKRLLFVGDPSLPPRRPQCQQNNGCRRGDPRPTLRRLKFLAALGFLGLLSLPVVVQQCLDVVLDIVDANVAGLL